MINDLTRLQDVTARRRDRMKEKCSETPESRRERLSAHRSGSKGLIMLLLYMDHSSAAPLWAPALLCQARWRPYVRRASDHRGRHSWMEKRETER